MNGLVTLLTNVVTVEIGFFVEFVSLSVMKAFTVASAITIAMSQVKVSQGLHQHQHIAMS